MTDARPAATTGSRADAADIARDGWVDRLLPAAVRPYARLARLDRPIGTWLLLFPGWWAIALAAAPGTVPDWRLLALFAIGALVMRGAGCTINDIVDRDFDARVARTRTRPIPAGEVSVRQAVAFLGLQCLIGLLILLRLTPTAIMLGVGVLALIVAYPFMKRVTWWPQLFLGLTFNWGAVLGWAAVSDGVPPAALLLYAGGIAWTLGYDTIYAHQDKEDDVLIGVKSSALALGERTRPWLFVFYAAALALFAAAGSAAGAGWGYWAGLAVALAILARQAATVDIDDPADCRRHFHANRWVGWAVFAGAVADRLLG
ncbi:4-hydroxybenzoate octaprenyltransferase [Stella sp.]|uniref:4-hydroxybenzoate octaprenyltransferase n=1 Tax=Stella sp. TaxID=2912054 RepID=UPI0035B2680D